MNRTFLKSDFSFGKQGGAKRISADFSSAACKRKGCKREKRKKARIGKKITEIVLLIYTESAKSHLQSEEKYAIITE